MDNQLSDQLSSSIPHLSVQSDSTADHSSPSVQFFPEYIFERSVECGTNKNDCIPLSNKFNILSNLSTINIEDLYSQTNTICVPIAQKQTNNTDLTDSQFLIDYPIIRRRINKQSPLEGGPSSSYHDIITQTDATKNHCDEETLISEQKQCSPSASVRLQSRTLERTQGRSVRTSGACFSDRNQTPVKCFSSLDQKTASGVSTNDGAPSVSESRAASRELSLCTSSASKVVPCNVTPSDSLGCRESEARPVKGPESWDVGASGFSEMADEFASKNKKRKVDNPKSESQFRHFFNRARSEDGSACSSFKRSSVFQKWGQVGLKTAGSSCVAEKSALIHGSLSKSNIQIMDSIGPAEKDDRRKKFRKWLKNRTSCLSKPKNNDCDVSRRDCEEDPTVPLPRRTDDTSASAKKPDTHAALGVPVLHEAQDKAAPELGEEEDCSSQSPKSRSTRLRPRNYRHFLLTKEHRTRAYLKERSHVLGRWFVKHFAHPYPSKEQKDKLAELTKMSRNQVSEWFGNMRRRVREATRDLTLCWEERVRRYNSLITGKSEPLPILPHDTINTWAPEVGGNTQHQPQNGVGPSGHTREREREETRALRPEEEFSGREVWQVESVECPLGHEDHHLMEVDRRYITQETRHEICGNTYPTIQGRQLINHEINLSNLKATQNTKEVRIPDDINHRSQRDTQHLVVDEHHFDSCSFFVRGQTVTNREQVHCDGALNDDLTSSGENLQNAYEGDSSDDDCRNTAQFRTPEPANAESAADDRSSSSKFKRDLIHRYLNDSSDSLPTPVSLPMENSVDENPSIPAKPDLQCTRRLFTEIRKRPDAPHTVPVARVDPWPSKESSRSCAKSMAQKNHPKKKSMSSIEDPLPLSYSSQPKTYSRISRPKPYYIIRSTSEPQSIVTQNIPLHSSFPNLLATSNSTSTIYQQNLSALSANKLSNSTGMEKLRIPLCTSSPKLVTPTEEISGHQMFVQSNSLSPLHPSPVAGPPANQVFTWSFTARPALLGHIDLQKSFAPAGPSVHSSRHSSPKFPLRSATVTSAYGPQTSMTELSPQNVIHSSDEITAAYSLMQLQKM